MRHKAMSILSASALTALTGCNSVQDPFLTGSTMPTLSPAMGNTHEVAAQFALASLPGAGQVVTVHQTLTQDAARQTVVLANKGATVGENSLIIDIDPPGEARFRQAPSRAQLQAEMRAALPGIAMTMTNTMHENAYGIYGYATGRSAAGGECVYAWQVIGAGSRSGMGSSHGASIRLRLCQAGGQPEQMAGMMRDLSLKPLTADIFAMLRLGQASGSTTAIYGTTTVGMAEKAYQQEAIEPESTAVAQAPKISTTYPRITSPDNASTSSRPSKEVANGAAVNVPLPAN